MQRERTYLNSGLLLLSRNYNFIYVYLKKIVLYFFVFFIPNTTFMSLCAIAITNKDYLLTYLLTLISDSKSRSRTTIFAMSFDGKCQSLQKLPKCICALALTVSETLTFPILYLYTPGKFNQQQSVI